MRGDIYRLRSPRRAKGHEQQGARYAVILQSNEMYLSTVIVAPTSTSAYPYLFRPEVTVHGLATRLMLDQLRAVDTEHAFGDPAGRVPLTQMQRIDEILPAVLGLY